MTGCFLCGCEKAGRSHYWSEGLTFLVECPNCGKYNISEQAALAISNGAYQKEVFPIVAGMVFDCFYYKNEVKTVLTDDFTSTKPIKTLEKLYRLAKFAYTEYQQGHRKDLATRPACCYADRDEYFELLDELKNIGIIDFSKAEQRGARGTPTTIVGHITLTTKARIAFDNGIETAEQFEEVFMNTKTGGDTVNVFGNGIQIQTGSNNIMINAVGTGNFIRDALKKGGVSDQQIAFIEPEITELSAECGKETVNEGKSQSALSKIKDKLGKFAYDIVVQTLSSLLAGKISGKL